MRKNTYYVFGMIALILVVIWPPLTVLILVSILIYKLLKKTGYIK